MNYQMLQRELKTLSEDLGQMAEGIIGPEPPASKPGQAAAGRMALPKEEIRSQLEYVQTKLQAAIGLTREPGTSPREF